MQLESQLKEERENVSLLQESGMFSIQIICIEVDELEEDNKSKDKEIAKLNKAISKSKSKKETQALVEELISPFLSFGVSLTIRRRPAQRPSRRCSRRAPFRRWCAASRLEAAAIAWTVWR